MRSFIVKIFILSTILCTSVLQSQGLDPSWKKSIILAESKNDSIYQPVATGFLVLFQNHIFIVTNKHVAERRGLFFRFNSKSLSNPTIRLSIDTLLSFINLPWAVSSTSDIAAIPLIFYPSLSRYRDSIDVKFLGISLFKDWNYINEGDDVFILGFPLGIGVSARFSAVYRYGIIALKEIEGNYLIDSNIFPGNSGGPVFMKPSIFDYRKGALGEGTVGYLVGIVSAFIPYSDVAISLQTRRPRVIFEENSGLAVVYSTDAIVKLLSDYIKTHKLN